MVTEQLSFKTYEAEWINFRRKEAACCTHSDTAPGEAAHPDFWSAKIRSTGGIFNISCVCAWLLKRRRMLRVKMFHAGDARPNTSTVKFTHAAAADKEQGEAVMRGEWRPGKKARSWRTSQVSRILRVERVLSTFPANTATDAMLLTALRPRSSQAQLLQMWCTPTLLAQQLW